MFLQIAKELKIDTLNWKLLRRETLFYEQLFFKSSQYFLFYESVLVISW